MLYLFLLVGKIRKKLSNTCKKIAYIFYNLLLIALKSNLTIIKLQEIVIFLS